MKINGGAIESQFWFFDPNKPLSDENTEEIVKYLREALKSGKTLNQKCKEDLIKNAKFLFMWQFCPIWGKNQSVAKFAITGVDEDGKLIEHDLPFFLFAGEINKFDRILDLYLIIPAIYSVRTQKTECYLLRSGLSATECNSISHLLISDRNIFGIRNETIFDYIESIVIDGK